MQTVCIINISKALCPDSRLLSSDLKHILNTKQLPKPYLAIKKDFLPDKFSSPIVFLQIIPFVFKDLFLLLTSILISFYRHLISPISSQCST